jgi:hypothetical protein
MQKGRSVSRAALCRNLNEIRSWLPHQPPPRCFVTARAVYTSVRARRACEADMSDDVNMETEMKVILGKIKRNKEFAKTVLRAQLLAFPTTNAA